MSKNENILFAAQNEKKSILEVLQRDYLYPLEKGCMPDRMYLDLTEKDINKVLGTRELLKPNLGKDFEDIMSGYKTMSEFVKHLKKNHDIIEGKSGEIVKKEAELAKHVRYLAISCSIYGEKDKHGLHDFQNPCRDSQYPLMAEIKNRKMDDYTKDEHLINAGKTLLKLCGKCPYRL